jgi:hypothetical protein
MLPADLLSGCSDKVITVTISRLLPAVYGQVIGRIFIAC